MKLPSSCAPDIRKSGVDTGNIQSRITGAISGARIDLITIRRVIVMSDIQYSKSWDRHAQKWANFKRMRDARLPKAIKAIELLSNLSNRGNYHYEEEEPEQMIRELELAIDSLAKAFKIDQRAQKLTAAEPISAPDPEIEDPDLLKPLAKSWVAWSLDNLQRGNRSEAIEMLKIGLKHQRSS
jgi:tetratricopeptide (TPR) repeat protein